MTSADGEGAKGTWNLGGLGGPSSNMNLFALSFFFVLSSKYEVITGFTGCFEVAETTVKFPFTTVPFFLETAGAVALQEN